MLFTFQLIVESKQVHQRKPQQFLDNTLSSKAISNHGPNQHKLSCTFLLAACAKCLNSHKSGCASILAGHAKSGSEVQRHIKFIIELVFEGARNAPTTFQTFSLTVAFTSGAQSALASLLTIFNQIKANANLQTTINF